MRAFNLDIAPRSLPGHEVGFFTALRAQNITKFFETCLAVGRGDGRHAARRAFWKRSARVLFIEKLADELAIFIEARIADSSYDIALNRRALPDDIRRSLASKTLDVFKKSYHAHSCGGNVCFFRSRAMHELMSDIRELAEKPKKLEFGGT